jgi:hypothetical protein
MMDAARTSVTVLDEIDEIVRRLKAKGYEMPFSGVGRLMPHPVAYTLEAAHISGLITQKECGRIVAGFFQSPLTAQLDCIARNDLVYQL